ncbi:MAG: methionyl-tRNA formyltransferase, partial [Prevotella sp.]|nr:methionyl-tRNA formyltransferase [Prevotella sp.]
FIRGLSPIPGAWSNVRLPNGSDLELKIYKATVSDIINDGRKTGELIVEKKHCYVVCEDKLLELQILQPSGRKRMQAIEFLNGLR